MRLIITIITIAFLLLQIIYKLLRPKPLNSPLATTSTTLTIFLTSSMSQPKIYGEDCHIYPNNSDSQYIDILGFSHTGLSPKQSKHVFTYDVFSNYKPFFSASSDSSSLHSGVGFLIANNFAAFVQKTGQLPGRVLFIDLFTKNYTKLCLIQVYVPPYSLGPNKQTRIQIRQYL